MTILVTGATGVLGAEVVRLAERAGHVVRAGSRRVRPEGDSARREWVRMDLASGHALAAAVAGVQCIIHLASDPLRSRRVDVAGTRRLIQGGARRRYSAPRVHLDRWHRPHPVPVLPAQAGRRTHDR